LRTTVLAVLGALVVSISFSTLAQAEKTLLWKIKDENNTVYLLGSVHLLSEGQSQLPPQVLAAYQEAEQIYTEIEIAAAMGEMLAPDNLALQTLPEGQTLASVLGSSLNARFEAELKKVGLAPEVMSRFQPWFAATMLQQVQMMRLGFQPQLGVDLQLAQRAQQDGKPNRGLETLKDQLGVFAGLPMKTQLDFLRSTLDEKDLPGKLEEISKAWRAGDTQTIEALLKEGAAESPQFFKALNVDRNLKWIPKIEAMIAATDEDFLVVAGALHFVGREGLIALLEADGYEVERIEAVQDVLN
jgi:uncharacterized protein